MTVCISSAKDNFITSVNFYFQSCSDRCTGYFDSQTYVRDLFRDDEHKDFVNV